jgi:hypothetical protein
MTKLNWKRLLGFSQLADGSPRAVLDAKIGSKNPPPSPPPPPLA